MFVHVSAKGELLDFRPDIGEESLVVTTSVQKRSYFLMTNGPKIVGAVANVCRDGPCHLSPVVHAEGDCVRITFYNVNGQPLLTEFNAILQLSFATEAYLPPAVAEAREVMLRATPAGPAFATRPTHAIPALAASAAAGKPN